MSQEVLGELCVTTSPDTGCKSRRDVPMLVGTFPAGCPGAWVLMENHHRQHPAEIPRGERHPPLNSSGDLRLELRCVQHQPSLPSLPAGIPAGSRAGSTRGFVHVFIQQRAAAPWAPCHAHHLHRPTRTPCPSLSFSFVGNKLTQRGQMSRPVLKARGKNQQAPQLLKWKKVVKGGTDTPVMMATPQPAHGWLRQGLFQLGSCWWRGDGHLQGSIGAGQAGRSVVHPAEAQFAPVAVPPSPSARPLAAAHGETAAWLFRPYSSGSSRARDILGTSLFPATLGGTGLAFLWKLCRLRTEKGKCQALHLSPVCGRRGSAKHMQSISCRGRRAVMCGAMGGAFWGEQHRGLRNARRETISHFPTSRVYPCCLSKNQGGTSCGRPQGGEQEGLGQMWSCSELETPFLSTSPSNPRPSCLTSPCSRLQNAYVRFWG